MWVCVVGETSVPKTTEYVLNQIGHTLFTEYTKEEAKDFWDSQIEWARKYENKDMRQAAINRIMFDILTSLGNWYDLMAEPEKDLWYNLVNYCECELPNCLSFLKTYKLDTSDAADEKYRHSQDYMNGWYYYSYDSRKEE